MYDLLGTREQHEQSGLNKYQARDYLALHLSIAKHETLGQQSPQESHHHHGIKQLSEGCREKDANGQHNQLEIDKQGESGALKGKWTIIMSTTATAAQPMAESSMTSKPNRRTKSRPDIGPRERAKRENHEAE